jgi:hypothetical protein
MLNRESSRRWRTESTRSKPHVAAQVGDAGSIVTRYAVFGRKPREGFTVMWLRCQETFADAPAVRGEMRKS